MKSAVQKARLTTLFCITHNPIHEIEQTIERFVAVVIWQSTLPIVLGERKPMSPVCRKCERMAATAEMRRSPKEGYVCKDKIPCKVRAKELTKKN